MHRLILTLTGLLCLVPFPVRADCPDFDRAVFASAIRDREPVGVLEALPEDAGQVYFFMEIHGGADTEVEVIWQSRDAGTTAVELPVGGERWRTWSSRNVGAFAPQDWAVEVRVGGCPTQVFKLPTRPAAEHPRIAAIHEALKQDDLPAARLALDEARRAQPAGLDEALRRITRIDIPLAELARDIERGHLYIAGSRQQRLADRIGPDSPEHERLLELENRLEHRKLERDRQVRRTLTAIEQILASTPAGLLPCPDSQEEASVRWEALKPELSLTQTGFSSQPPGQLTLLDARTGLEYRLGLSCRNPFAALRGDPPAKDD